MLKLVFINAGNDKTEGGNANMASFPPLGIISMATAIKEHFRDLCEVYLIDGQLETLDDACGIIASKNPDVVLVSMYCTGINYVLECVRKAKACGAITVLGNDHAKAHYDTLLKNVPEIDLISLEEFGEFMCMILVRKLLLGESIYSVPNVAYRTDDKVVCNARIYSDHTLLVNPLEHIPLPNRSLLDKKYWNTYLDNFKKVKSKIYSKDVATGVTTMNRARGCMNSHHRCAYCGIGDLSLYKASPISFWKDIEKAQMDVNANFFYECFDNFTFSTNWLKEIAACRPSTIKDFYLCVYSSANRITPEICDLLHHLGVYLVNLGLDSGDELGLRLLKGQNVSIDDNYRAVDMLTQNNMEMHISFVLMGMGSNKSTKASMDKTMDFIRYLVKNTTVTILDCALFYPDRTAPVGSLIWNPENFDRFKKSYELSYIDTSFLEAIHKKWKNQVYIDSAEITRDFARLCGTDYELLLDYQREIKKICDENNISFGYSQAGRID